MILIIDNYDSFVFTLARYVQKQGIQTSVVRNNKITIDDIKISRPEAIILSPGPCTPQKAGICIKLVKSLGAEIPMLGVCLGHQAIGEAYGGRTVRTNKPIHGKSSSIQHDCSALFQGVESPFEAGRYHSLISDISNCKTLKVTAKTTTGETMAFQHIEHPVFGVQFHPESALTESGQQIINNFLLYCNEWNKTHKKDK